MSAANESSPGLTPSTPFHRLSIREVYSSLETDLKGLTKEQVEERLVRYGPNELAEVKGKSLILKFLANFVHLMAILLWVGGIMAFVAQMPQLGFAIWAVILINGVFSFVQEFKAEKATEALKKMLPSFCRVLRDGGEQRILATELVPGDTILLAEGDRISADARLVQESELRADQSTLTGESHPVRKTSEAVLRQDITYNELPNLVFAGTAVAAGTGKAIVFATGMNSQFGKIAGLTQGLAEELSPLQKEVARLTQAVTVIAVAIGVLFFVLAVAMAGVTLAESFIFAVGMVVAFVPEGLLPTVTLALAMGVQRMAKRGALIKKLSAVETLGCTTVICTDKTGTLTQNEMTVRNVWMGGRPYTVTGVGYAPTGQVLDEQKRVVSSPVQGDLRYLMLVAGLCNNARLLPAEGESKRWTILGDPTEAALRVAATKAGLNLEEELVAMPCLREVPFESRRKRMSTIHEVDGVVTIYSKGAPKEVLSLCTTIQMDGEAKPLDEAMRVQIMAANDDYARNGLRVLAMAMRPVPDTTCLLGGIAACTSEAVEEELTFLGLMAMQDPPRVEVAAAVQKCHHAGIRVVMITGDYGLTAESIARRIGIVQGDRPRIITGVELDALEDAALKEALAGEVIFARVAPENKLRVVRVLQELGNVVAVTGDGVNDAPALKKADIGVAMGIAGTDVAKEAADMILTDDNFASIVNAVEEGRAVYANIKKFCTYIFTSNTPEAVPFILYVLSGARIPLAITVMQVLCIDLGTDIVPALALGVEPPEPGIMDRPPRSLKEHVINGKLLMRAYLLLGPIQSLAAMAAFYFRYWTHGYWGQWIDLPGDGPLYHSATAMALGAVVATQIGNLFAQRTERTSFFRHQLFGNRLIWVGIASELTLVNILIYVPFFQGLFDTYAFEPINWLFLFAWTPSLLLTDEIGKIYLRWRDRRILRHAPKGGV